MIFLLVNHLKSEISGYDTTVCAENSVMVLKLVNLFCLMFPATFRGYCVMVIARMDTPKYGETLRDTNRYDT